MNDLHDLHILVTREGEALCRLITEKGGHAIHFPTIAFTLLSDTEVFQQALAQLDDQDWLIFISPQAVFASMVHIQTRWPQLSTTVKFAAVGAGTAQALYEAGAVVAIHPETEWNSEGVLNLPEFQQVAGKKIAIIRGVGGRMSLDKGLAERGAQVLPVIAYERVLPKADISPYLHLLNDDKIDIIVCTSCDGVKNLKILFGETAWMNLKEIPLIVISERIKMLAQDLGFRRIEVSRNASQQAMLEIMAELRKT